jgi:hypothetical protein
MAVRFRRFKEAPSVAINYVADQMKTTIETDVLPPADEKHIRISPSRPLVTGINCIPQFAAEEMNETAFLMHKNFKIKGYHIVMSFNRDEISPVKAHRLGIELMQKVFADRFEIVIATHVNTGAVHNHFIVGNITLDDDRGVHTTYVESALDYESESICRREGLKSASIARIEGVNSYLEAVESNKGRDTRSYFVDFFLTDADRCIMASYNIRDFYENMKMLGYTMFKTSSGVWARAPNFSHPYHLDRRGSAYTEDGIKRRIFENTNQRDLYDYVNNRDNIRLKGAFSRSSKSPGLASYFFSIMCLIYKAAQKPYSYVEIPRFMRTAINVFHRLCRDFRYLRQSNFRDAASLNEYSDLCRERKKSIQRKVLNDYNKSKKRASKEPDWHEEYLERTSSMRKESIRLTKEINSCKSIKKDLAIIRQCEIPLRFGLVRNIDEAERKRAILNKKEKGKIDMEIEASLQSEPAMKDDDWKKSKQVEREEAFGALDKAVNQIKGDGNIFRKYLDVVSRFANYSAINCLLIMDQRPEALQIADAAEWKKKGAYIKKGEHGFLMFGQAKKYVHPDGSETIYYNVKRVFDVTQTDKKYSPLYEGSYDAKRIIESLRKSSSIKIETSRDLDGMLARYDPEKKKIYIKEGEYTSAMLSGIYQEAAHAIMDRHGPYNRAVNSFDAYCAAYIQSRRTGINGASFDFSKLPDRIINADPDTLKKEVTRIRDVSGELTYLVNNSLGRNSKDRDADMSI